jgi:hypothetical protein
MIRSWILRDLFSIPSLGYNTPSEGRGRVSKNENGQCRGALADAYVTRADTAER